MLTDEKLDKALKEFMRTHPFSLTSGISYALGESEIRIREALNRLLLQLEDNG